MFSESRTENEDHKDKNTVWALYRQHISKSVWFNRGWHPANKLLEKEKKKVNSFFFSLSKFKFMADSMPGRDKRDGVPLQKENKGSSADSIQTASISTDRRFHIPTLFMEIVPRCVACDTDPQGSSPIASLGGIWVSGHALFHHIFIFTHEMHCNDKQHPCHRF